MNGLFVGRGPFLPCLQIWSFIGLRGKDCVAVSRVLEGRFKIAGKCLICLCISVVFAMVRLYDFGLASYLSSAVPTAIGAAFWLSFLLRNAGSTVGKPYVTH